jgi:hypothetical protein
VLLLLDACAQVFPLLLQDRYPSMPADCKVRHGLAHTGQNAWSSFRCGACIITGGHCEVVHVVHSGTEIPTVCTWRLSKVASSGKRRIPDVPTVPFIQWSMFRVCSAKHNHTCKVACVLVDHHVLCKIDPMPVSGSVAHLLPYARHLCAPQDPDEPHVAAARAAVRQVRSIPETMGISNPFLW